MHSWADSTAEAQTAHMACVSSCTILRKEKSRMTVPYAPNPLAQSVKGAQALLLFLDPLAVDGPANLIAIPALLYLPSVSVEQGEFTEGKLR